jgi:uncharacterized membrane protein
VIHIEHDVEIDRPVNDVFAYVTDPTRLPEWQATALEGRLDSQEMGKGARIVEIRKFLGRHIESTMDVTAYEPDQRFDVEVTSGPVHYRASQTFEGSDGGTRLHLVFEGDPAGFFRVADPLVENQLRRQVEDDFRTLKLVLELGSA